MKSLARLAAISALTLGLVFGVPSVNAATKKPKAKKTECCECCKDGKCTDTASKDGKCAKCDGAPKKS